MDLDRLAYPVRLGFILGRGADSVGRLLRGWHQSAYHLGIRRCPAFDDFHDLDLRLLRRGGRRDVGDSRRGVPRRRGLARHIAPPFRIHLGQVPCDYRLYLGGLIDPPRRDDSVQSRGSRREHAGVSRGVSPWQLSPPGVDFQPPHRDLLRGSIVRLGRADAPADPGFLPPRGGFSGLHLLPLGLLTGMASAVAGSRDDDPRPGWISLAERRPTQGRPRSRLLQHRVDSA